jgi:hypothetical protein
MKRILCGAAAILISTAAFMPAQAMAQGYSVIVRTAPPPPRQELVPAPRRGYEWAPGYWNYSGNKHKWTAGHWERVHAGQRYQRPEWQQTSNGWRLNKGGWQRNSPAANGPRGDRDGDGVPNRFDSNPNNPYRR